MLRSVLGQAARRLPMVGPRLQRLYDYERFCSLGHYYSPLVSAEDVRERGGELFDTSADAVTGVNLDVEHQLRVLDEIGPLCRDWPFPDHKPESAGAKSLRYWTINGFFQTLDGHALLGMLRRLQPRRVVEVGSGFSSALMLDARDLYLGGPAKGPHLTFIEPYPERLESLLRPEDHAAATIIREGVQRAPLSLYEQLEPNDILFIDSSHVGKLGSDVNHLFFEALPRLKPGVVVHVHDVFWPFSYPRAWVEEGRHWNEAFYLRMLLLCNDTFRIEFWCDQLNVKHRDRLKRALAGPRQYADDFHGGASIWLRRAR